MKSQRLLFIINNKKLYINLLIIIFIVIELVKNSGNVAYEDKWKKTFFKTLSTLNALTYKISQIELVIWRKFLYFSYHNMKNKILQCQFFCNIVQH